jgi:hypothetical protein
LHVGKAVGGEQGVAWSVSNDPTVGSVSPAQMPASESQRLKCGKSGAKSRTFPAGHAPLLNETGALLHNNVKNHLLS